MSSCSGDVPTITADDFENNNYYVGDFGRSMQEHSKALCQPGAPGK